MAERAINVAVFGGSTPRRAEHLVPAERAVLALDCKLESGALESWREPRLVHTVAAGARSVYQAFNCCWLTSTQCASWAEGSPEERHVFATQYNDVGYPVRLVLNDLCEPTVLRLGLPCPATRLTVAGGSAPGKGAYARNYAYQFEDRFGHRSTLSEPSLPVVVADGTPVTVSGWAIPAGGWDIQNIIVFRTAAGFESATQQDANTLEAAWMEVARIPAGQASYVDARRNMDLDEALREDVVEPPPEALRGMTWVRSMNRLFGFVGRELWASENGNYHNWPHTQLLDDNIRGVVESNGMLYVVTDGHPYVVQAAVEEAQAGVSPAVRLPESLPLVGSGYRSVIAVPSGAVYPTHHGLVWMTGTRPPVVLSATFYSEQDWQTLQPDTMRGAYHNGRLFLFFRNGACCMAMRDGASAEAELGAHTELSARPDEVLVTRTGRLFLRQGQEVLEWDRGVQLMPHRYVSTRFLLGVPFNFGAMQIMMHPTGPERVRLEYDGGFEALDETIQQTEVFTLPTWATGQEFQWTLEGTGRVVRVDLSPSMKEL